MAILPVPFLASVIDVIAPFSAASQAVKVASEVVEIVIDQVKIEIIIGCHEPLAQILQLMSR